MAKIFVLSAPSGAGKSSLINAVLKKFPRLFFSVSATTRKPRAGEQEGREYYFKQRAEFEAMIARGELAEYQEIYGNYYGTPIGPLRENLAAGRDVIMDIDVYGKKKLDMVFPDAVGIFITVPSLNELEQRLRLRKTDDPSIIKKRVQEAKKEIEFAEKQGVYKYTVINDDFQRAVGELGDIIETESRTADIR